MSERGLDVSGTLVWYYYICPREVWLISHQINPDQDNDNVSLGRYIGENTYLREKKEISVGNSKIDVFHTEDGKMVIGEVKKSSKYKESARMQLAFYLSELKKRGIIARGELRFPKEKVREEVILDERTEQGLDKVRREILRIVYMEKPPQPVKIQFC
ncbi:CRISPR-associated protein Cas4 [Desulforamulus hydrothermalis]|uniref:CRISPR-associated exonuclease Cas4 n=1 Tax=Desulforamulus hydrothermalis Lam5 = DSM 18033 TaxID=1121428 RepID=K8EGF8_9FIRM|nr:CRISPR-associated protein Cas4 [Desulforamulus hydrothermalis]CCO07751.1 CRISPR-associated protein Cas4 [Desulforamulus hydrothermalis Lam5 = DSM 18033]SHH46677.1 CRISPR-associated exonuclease, Cas4 family [Desulforamulus hydrothermalis Lam5 = DSM 18033]